MSVLRARHCARCWRARCLCHLALLPPLDHATEVHILQHPLEQREVKGTARLLQLSLTRCALHVGETFAPPPNPDGRVEALLYPGDGPTPLPTGTAPERLRLYVLDGTWRKTRLLLHLNPWLQALPRWPLGLHGPVPATRYRVRKAQAAQQLSTLEAVAYALPPPAPVGALLQVLEGLIASIEHGARPSSPADTLAGSPEPARHAPSPKT